MNIQTNYIEQKKRRTLLSLTGILYAASLALALALYALTLAAIAYR